VDEATSGGGSTVTIGLLRVVRDSANGFGPLKSIAGELCLVLESCKVLSPFNRLCSQCLQLPQQTEVDEQAIESLALRVKALFESLSAPIPLGDVDEEARERELKQ